MTLAGPGGRGPAERGAGARGPGMPEEPGPAPEAGPGGARGLRLGLVDGAGRYLTAESFGFEVNAAAPGLKRKQTWALEAAGGPGPAVLLRSCHLGRYLSAAADGRLGCEAERPGRDCRFLVLPQPDGRWALRSEPHGRFVGGAGDRLGCSAPGAAGAALWAVHLAAHPLAHLRSVGRRRYAQLCPQGDELAAAGGAPWGRAALVSLVFLQGRYGLRCCDGRFLRRDGRLVPEPEARARYTLELRAGRLAFRDCEGRYLAPAGPAGTLRAGRHSRPGPDELFELEDSPPQVALLAANRRYVSVRQGVNVSANQDEQLDCETFLMQLDAESAKCAFCCSAGAYWALDSHAGIQATATQVSAGAQFEVEWRGRRVALRASNGRYVRMKRNGQLAAVSDLVGEAEEFALQLTNRPLLVLRGPDGFVSLRRGSAQLDTNRSAYDGFQLRFCDGAYHIRGRGVGFWRTDSHGRVRSDGERGEDFVLELRAPGRLAIRAPSGKYLRGGASGLLRADADAPAGEALWEY